MRVLVIGSGGREQAIAWACRRHGHEVTLLPELPPPNEHQPDLVIPGPEAALVAGVADECASRGIPCFGPTADLARLESSKGYARELATTLGIPGPRFARFQSNDHDAAIAWYRAQQATPSSSSSTAWRQARASRSPRRPSETIAAIRATTEPFLLEERMSGPGVLADRPVRRDHRRRPAAGPGPQAHRRGRHRPEHRRHGRLRPGSGARTTQTSWWRRSSSRSSTTSPPPARRTSASSTPG